MHVGNFQVVAKMAVGVLMVIAFGQLAKLLAKAFTTGVIFAGGAVAVAAPVSKALSNSF